MTYNIKRRATGLLSSFLCIAALLSGCAAGASSPGTSPSVTGNLSVSAVPTAADAGSKGTASSEIELISGGGEIKLNGGSISFSGSGAEVSNGVVTIKGQGTYTVSGTLSEGQIVVEAGESDKVLILLAGADITCTTGSPIYVKSGDKVTIGLKDGTENKLADGANYSKNDEADAVIFSKSDLKITGTGALTINANYDNGVHSKDDLKIYGGRITINAVNDGVKGKDSVAVANAELNIKAGGDGIQSDNEETDKGYIEIQSGTITIEASKKAIQAQNYITVDGGTINISSEGDAIHAEKTLTINDGYIKITKSYEGLESSAIVLNGGTAIVNSSDDGINGAGGKDNSAATSPAAAANAEAPATAPAGGRQGGGATGEAPTVGLPTGGVPTGEAPTGAMPGGGGMKGGAMPGGGGLSSSTGTLTINGGTWIVNASGDGVDVNGSITMTGGTVIVQGPTNNGNGSLDYDSGFEMTGGVLIAAGSSGMATTPSKVSGVNTMHILTSQAAGTLIRITDESGNELVTFSSQKAWQSFVFTSASIKLGATYKIYTGGSYSGGTEQGGYYSGGIYSGGTVLKTFTQSNATTTVR